MKTPSENPLEIAAKKGNLAGLEKAREMKAAAKTARATALECETLGELVTFMQAHVNLKAHLPSHVRYMIHAQLLQHMK